MSPSSDPGAPSYDPGARSSDPFESAIEALMDREFEESPLMASALGRDGFDHRLDDCSADGFERRAAGDRDWLRRLTDFDPDSLTSDQAIDRELVISQLGRRESLAGWEEWRRSPEGYLETGITELFLLAMRPEAELTEAAAARLHGIGSVLDEAAKNLDPARASRVVVDRSLAGCVANIGFAREEVAGLAAVPDTRRRLRAAGEVGARAYEKFARYLSELAPRCTGSFVFGEERYDDVLRRGELLDTDTRALRRQGWDEYHRVADQMGEVASRITGRSGHWADAVRELQLVHPPSIDAMRSEYQRVCLEARRFMTERDLVTNPPDEHCSVMPAPVAVRATLAVACYIAPPMFKPSRTGHFFVPYPVDADDPEEVNGLLESNAPYSMATTAVHEAYPGHHWHLMTMKGARPIRRVFGSTYFIEGWALYAEGMMREAGFFTPEQELGQLEARLFRAARIVVDTSLHTGEMSFDKAVAFMHDKALLPLPTARSEVARYCAWPTQASAYLTGAMAIERARDVWMAGGGTLKA
ncbi:MAG: DUF885 domain-containing protein, partial [Acidimicrobiales bacterium]